MLHFIHRAQLIFDMGTDKKTHIRYCVDEKSSPYFCMKKKNNIRYSMRNIKSVLIKNN